MSDTCSIEFGEIDLSQQNPTLAEVINTEESELKQLLVDYVGAKKNPENDEVTVELIVETVAEEFPEFALALAEENYIRGYQQALNDAEQGEKLYKEALAKKENEQSD